jgi:hypothetical protein
MPDERTPKQLSLFAWRPPVAPAKPPAAPARRVLPPMETLLLELKAARQELHNLQVMAMKPDRTAEQLEMLHQFERSCRAEIKLRRRAIEYQRGLEQP